MRDCIQCLFRTDRHLEKKITNESRFCLLEFTQNPKTAKTKANALKNGAHLCSFVMGSSKGWPLIELVLAHPDSLNKALSALPFKIRIRDYL